MKLGQHTLVSSVSTVYQRVPVGTDEVIFVKGKGKTQITGYWQINTSQVALYGFCMEDLWCSTNLEVFTMIDTVNPLSQLIRGIGKTAILLRDVGYLSTVRKVLFYGRDNADYMRYVSKAFKCFGCISFMGIDNARLVMEYDLDMNIRNVWVLGEDSSGSEVKEVMYAV